MMPSRPSEARRATSKHDKHGHYGHQDWQIHDSMAVVNSVQAGVGNPGLGRASSTVRIADTGS